MKKILAGCAVVIVIAALGLAVATFFAYRAARPMFEGAGDYVSRAKEMASLGDRISNKSSYTAPANGELTQDQVERFLAVQASTRAKLGDRWDELKVKSESLRKRTADGADLSLADLGSVWSDLTGVYLDARRAQVAALNAQKFSSDEYGWVRRRVYAAAGVQLAGGIDLSAIEELARRGGRDDLKVPELPLPDVPEANLRLVKPHTAKIQEWLPLAFLGL
jgi:hypothetical protein